MRRAIPLLLFFCVALLHSNSAEAQTPDIRKKIAKCAAIAGDLERLECYDQLARELGLVRAATTRQSAGSGKWLSKIETNPVDDTKTVNLVLVADEGKSAFGQSIALVIRCMSNETQLYITWNSYLGDEANVLTRVGQQQATTQRWLLSTDSQATFYPGSAIQLIRSLMQVDGFVAQVTPYGESPVTAVFDVKGLSRAIEPLQQTCGWQ